MKDDATENKMHIDIQFRSVQYLDRLVHRGDMTDNSVDSLLLEAIVTVSTSCMGSVGTEGNGGSLDFSCLVTC